LKIEAPAVRALSVSKAIAAKGNYILATMSSIKSEE